ncbi:MAG: RNase adapter RapZ [Clostridiales Family XIII bacterium]|jgi:UPF0042 nucleotide-binding protein|nr:RNase adapter RapZ [Clostridiales Family XIII bacterium]
MEAIIVTGMSGAGKSCAYECFEDLGYYCIDNLPPVLIDNVIELLERGKREVTQAVFVIDIRGGEFFDDMKNALLKLDESGIPRKILFLDASDEALLRRFNETRRAHPLAAQSNLEGIAKERQRMAEAKRMSDLVIDTSGMKVAALKDEVKKLFLQKSEDVFGVNIMSFGFKYGVPPEADMVFDMRFIPNPFYVPHLKGLTGNNKKVRDYVMGAEVSAYFKEQTSALLEKLIPGYIREGKHQLNLAFGCTGGRHRSVTMAIVFHELLAEAGHRVSLSHRDI